MIYPNELLTNIIQTFGSINNPFLDAFKSKMPATAAEAPSAAVNLRDTAELAETLQQNVQEQITLMSSIMSCALRSAQEIVELNLNAAHTSVQKNSTLISQVLVAKSIIELQPVFVAFPQATSAEAVSYSQHLTRIVADACTEMARSTQRQVPLTIERVTKLIDQAARTLPAGSENVIALTKSAMSTAVAGYQQVVKTAEQATQTFQGNAEQFGSNGIQATAKKASGGNGSRRAH